MPLRVTIEVIPWGQEDLKRTLATVEIENVTDLAEHSNYSILLDRRRLDGEVAHKRSDGFWILVHKTLAKLATGAK